MNRFFGTGRLTKDPSCSYTNSGKCVCTMNVAFDSGYGDKKQTAFLTVVVWDKMGESCGKNLAKGRKVAIEGRVQTRSYDTENGKRYVTEIVAQTVEFGDKPKNETQPANNQPFGEPVPPEDIPF